jgi:hypothetical protein
LKNGIFRQIGPGVTAGVTSIRNFSAAIGKQSRFAATTCRRSGSARCHRLRRPSATHVPSSEPHPYF